MRRPSSQQPLQPELEESGTAAGAEPVEDALAVVDFETPLQVQEPVDAHRPALEPAAPDQPVIEIDVGVSGGEFPGAGAPLAKGERPVGDSL